MKTPLSGLSLLENKDDPLEDWRQKFWTSYKVSIKLNNIIIMPLFHNNNHNHNNCNRLLTVIIFYIYQTGVVYWSTMQVRYIVIV